MIVEGGIRRRDNRIWYLILGVFAATFLFTFLNKQFTRESEAEAASLANFDPGYIISDWQMGNYSSMTEAEIQAFLNSKGNCRDTNISKASSYPSLSYHIKDGHFVCLAEETFGDGINYGEAAPAGDSAAHIIWQAAQDYKINPQVLIVLLQKEQGLITDSWPNNVQYRSATGYGCPDTAACSTKYYGFKNQIRNAAAMFRTVLDGGWTNYPLGENYVQYNPSAACGGSVVNIRSLATSALYRYTPYQPNAGALAAGYGTAYCGAYGNRNFYLYFQDWFGGITYEKIILGDYKDMVVSRVFFVKKGSRYIDYESKTIAKRQKSSFEFFTHLNYQDNNLCLSIGENRNCYLYSDLEELEYSEVMPMSVSRMLTAGSGSKAIDYEKNIITNLEKERIIFSHKVQINGQLCLIEMDSDKTKCVLYESLSELPKSSFSNMSVPRRLYSGKSTRIIDVETGITEEAEIQEKEHYNSLTYWFGSLCLRPDSLKNENKCILYTNLKELNDVRFEKMTVPRFFKINDSMVYDAEIGEKTNAAENAGVLFLEEKTDTKDGLCLRAISANNNKNCYLYNDVTEISNFTSMAVPRKLTISHDAQLYDLEKAAYSSETLMAGEEFFTDKITLGDGSLCLRSLNDSISKQYRCIKYENLSEN